MLQGGPEISVNLAIGREARDALYHMLLADIASIGDISIYLSTNEAAHARRLRQRYEMDMRLLDDLGWDEATDGEQFVITMPSETLRPTLERLYWSSTATLAYPAELDQRTIDHATQCSLVCSELLSRMGERPGPESTDVWLTVQSEVARRVVRKAGLRMDVHGYWTGPIGQRTRSLAQALDWGLARLARDPE